MQILRNIGYIPGLLLSLNHILIPTIFYETDDKSLTFTIILRKQLPLIYERMGGERGFDVLTSLKEKKVFVPGLDSP